MALLKIAQLGDPVLRQPCQDVDRNTLLSSSFQQFIDDMVDTMRDAQGAGLAAPQVFRPVRLCILEVQKNKRYPYKPTIPLTILVNPSLEPLGTETFSNYEGCLSVPNLRGRVRRSTRVRVRAWTREGLPIEIKARGLTAGTYQHELDHLDGKLFVDTIEDAHSLCTLDNYQRHYAQSFAEEAAELVSRFGS